jgi:hypothetical protein
MELCSYPLLGFLVEPVGPRKFIPAVLVLPGVTLVDMVMALAAVCGTPALLRVVRARMVLL